MLDLLAQHAPAQGTLGLIDKLARTPLSVVLMFVAACTVFRLVIHPYLVRVPPHRRTGLYSAVRFLNEVLDALVYAGVVVFMLIRPFGIQTFQIPSESMVPTLLTGDFIIANKGIYRYSEPKHGDIIVFRPPDRAKNAGQGEIDFIKRLIGKPGDVIEVKAGQLYRNGQPIDEPYKNEVQPDEMLESSYDFKLVRYEGPYEPWQGEYIPVMMIDSGWGSVANYGTGTAWEYAIGADEERTGASNAAFRRSDQLTEEEKERMRYLLEAEPAPIPEGHYLFFGDNRVNSYDSRGWGLVPRENLVGRSEFIWAPISRWGATD